MWPLKLFRRNMTNAVISGPWESLFILLQLAPYLFRAVMTLISSKV